MLSLNRVEDFHWRCCHFRVPSKNSLKEVKFVSIKSHQVVLISDNFEYIFFSFWNLCSGFPSTAVHCCESCILDFLENQIQGSFAWQLVIVMTFIPDAGSSWFTWPRFGGVLETRHWIEIGSLYLRLSIDRYIALYTRVMGELCCQMENGSSEVTNHNQANTSQSTSRVLHTVNTGHWVARVQRLIERTLSQLKQEQGELLQGQGRRQGRASLWWCLAWRPTSQAGEGPPGLTPLPGSEMQHMLSPIRSSRVPGELPRIQSKTCSRSQGTCQIHHGVSILKRQYLPHTK